MVLKSNKLLHSFLLFCVLSLFTIYPNINILSHRAETIIDYNAKNKNDIAAYILNKGDFLTTSININKHLEALEFRLNTAQAKKDMQIILSQGDISQTYNIKPSTDHAKKINIQKNLFTQGKLDIKIINSSDINVYYTVNYPQVTSGYIKLNNSKNIQAFSLNLKLFYNGSEFYLVSWIMLIIIILIQAYISYIVFARDLQDNRIYWLSALLFLCVYILRYPLLTLWPEPVAETLSSYIKYNIDHNFTLIDMLLLTDNSMTYLASLINIIGRLIGLEKYLLIYLYMSGIIIACLWLALFIRNSLREYFPDYIRIILTFSLLGLWNFHAMYINSMFTYWGIYFIIYLYLIDLNKLSRVQYILSMFLIFLIINNKMSYLFLIPSAFLMIFYYWKESKRKLYMQFIIIFSCFMNYIVYSIVMPSERSRHSGILERLFELDKGIIKMLDGIASVLNINILFHTYTQLFSFIIVVLYLIYSIYTIIKNKNIKNSGYIILVILTAIFMSQYIHVVSNFDTVKSVTTKFNEFNYLPFDRRFYMLYHSVCTLLIYSIWLFYKKNKNKNIGVFIVCFFLMFSIQWQNKAQANNHLYYINHYKNRYLEYYHLLNNQWLSIPVRGPLWNYSKNAYQQIYRYDNNTYTLLNIKTFNKNINIVQNFNNLSQIINDKCLISIHINYTDIQFNTGKVSALFFDKNSNIISKAIQLNESNYYASSGTYMSFMFEKPICNIDKIEFVDEENKPVWVTGRIIMGIVK